MSEIQTIIEEAKRGILTISDFYKDEVFGYFMARAIMEVFMAIPLIIPVLCIRKFYKEEIFTIGNSTAAVLWASDLNRILQTDVFVYDMHNPYIHSRDLVILFKDDNWNMGCAQVFFQSFTYLESVGAI